MSHPAHRLVEEDPYRLLFDACYLIFEPLVEVKKVLDVLLRNSFMLLMLTPHSDQLLPLRHKVHALEFLGLAGCMMKRLVLQEMAALREARRVWRELKSRYSSYHSGILWNSN